MNFSGHQSEQVPAVGGRMEMDTTTVKEAINEASDASGPDYVPQEIVEVNESQFSGLSGPRYKRGRGRSFFKDTPKKGVACQVPGCDRSIHKLKDYYKRYKICPYHLELSHMVVEGQAIRFCQQCGRFQLLDEFDGDRRSCKKKLEKHNERRRKAELTASEQEKDAPYVPRSYRYRYPEDRDPKSSKQHKNSSPTHLSDVNGEYLDQQQQGYYMPAPEYDASFLAALADVAVSAQHQDDPDAGQASFSSLPSFSLPAPQLLHPSSQPHAPFPLQITSHPLPIDAHPTSTSHTSIENADADASISPAILNMLTSAINSTAEGTAKTAATEVPLAEVKADLLDALKKDADAAPPGSRRLLPHMNGSFTQSSRSAFSRLRIDSSDRDRSTIGDPFASNPSSFNSRGYYYSRNSSMNSNNAAVEAAAAAAAAAAAFQNSVPAAASAEVMRVLEGALGIDQGEMAHWMGMLHSVRGEQQQPVNEHHMAPLQQQPGHPVSEAVMTEAAGTDAVPAMAMECAKQSLQPEPIPASMDNEVVNMCVKVFKATPDQLPAGLISELKSWMSKTPSYGEVTARPGCVHLSVASIANGYEVERAHRSFSAIIKRLLAACGILHPQSKNLVYAQFSAAAAAAGVAHATSTGVDAVQRVAGGKGVIFQGDTPRMLLDLLPDHATSQPALNSVYPCAVVPSYEGAFIVYGDQFDARQDKVYCRYHGTNVTLEVLRHGCMYKAHEDEDDAMHKSGGGWMLCSIPKLRPGAYEIEVQRGLFVSERICIAVLEDRRAVTELLGKSHKSMDVSSLARGIDHEMQAMMHKVGVLAHLYSPAQQQQRTYDRRQDNDRSRQTAQASADGSDALRGATVRVDLENQDVKHRLECIAYDVAITGITQRWPGVLCHALHALHAMDIPAPIVISSLESRLPSSKIDPCYDVPLLTTIVAFGSVDVLHEMMTSYLYGVPPFLEDEDNNVDEEEETNNLNGLVISEANDCSLQTPLCPPLRIPADACVVQQPHLHSPFSTLSIASSASTLDGLISLRQSSCMVAMPSRAGSAEAALFLPSIGSASIGDVPMLSSAKKQVSLSPFVMAVLLEGGKDVAMVDYLCSLLGDLSHRHWTAPVQRLSGDQVHSATNGNDSADDEPSSDAFSPIKLALALGKRDVLQVLVYREVPVAKESLAMLEKYTKMAGDNAMNQPIKQQPGGGCSKGGSPYYNSCAVKKEEESKDGNSEVDFFAWGTNSYTEHMHDEVVQMQDAATSATKFRFPPVAMSLGPRRKLGERLDGACAWSRASSMAWMRIAMIGVVMFCLPLYIPRFLSLVVLVCMSFCPVNAINSGVLLAMLAGIPFWCGAQEGFPFFSDEKVGSLDIMLRCIQVLALFHGIKYVFALQGHVLRQVLDGFSSGKVENAKGQLVDDYSTINECYVSGDVKNGKGAMDSGVRATAI